MNPYRQAPQEPVDSTKKLPKHASYVTKVLCDVTAAVTYQDERGHGSNNVRVTFNADAAPTDLDTVQEPGMRHLTSGEHRLYDWLDASVKRGWVHFDAVGLIVPWHRITNVIIVERNERTVTFMCWDKHLRY